MSAALNVYVEQRVRILALAFLTRQQNLLVTDTALDGIDALASMLPTKPGAQQVRNYAVIWWGTNADLPNESSASKFANARWKKGEGRATYYLPTLTLTFSAATDQGYFAWALAPRVDAATHLPRLEQQDRLECRGLRPATIETITSQIDAWYDALDHLLLAR